MKMTALTLKTIEASLKAQEASQGDVRGGLEKAIIWGNSPQERTDFSILYIHGFSASRGEVHPLPETVARAVNANIFYTRLPGHGRSEDAMGKPSLKEWYATLDEALEIGRIIGKKTIVLSCSTGGTLFIAGLREQARAKNIAGAVFMSPNFAVHNPNAWMGHLPFFRYWAHIVAGHRIGFEPRNELHSKYWTTQYPPKAIVPMMQLIKRVSKMDVSQIKIPALFIYSDDDTIVRSTETDKIYANWGGGVHRISPKLNKGDDINAHVIAGDALSPSQSETLSQKIIDWIKTYAKPR